MSIEKRIERIEAILDARGLDWDHPRVEEEPAKEALLDGLPDIRTFAQPNLRWRILEPGEVVCSSDWVKAKSDFLSDPPSGLGWRPVEISAGMTVCKDDFCVFARPVVDEPAKEAGPEHPAGPKPDPGEGYRILSKDPLEDLSPGDEYFVSWDGLWHESSDASKGIREQRERRWYRRKIEPPKPAWGPKIGDWVLVTRPENWKEWKDILWRDEMHAYDGKVFQVVGAFETSFGHRVKLHGIDWFFHRDWLSPSIKHFAEPPAIDKPPEPEYREPVLPADGGMACEFSEEGNFWSSGRLGGVRIGKGWFSTCGVCWRHCRIKKDA